MSVTWALVAGFLYVEIAIVLLLVLPIASPKTWAKIFRSRILSALGNQTQFYFLALLGILALFAVDAIREMRKYSSINPLESPGSSGNYETQVHMKLFRAQRNFYISGFALFLSLVIRRLVILITSLATSQACSEASMKQAQSATTTARTLLQTSGDESQNRANEAHDKEVTELKTKISNLEKELTKEKKDKEAVKSQADNLSKEYDRLVEERNKLEKKVADAGGASGDKKDD